MTRAGVLVVDKPKGPTSHDVVARLRKALGTRQIGHAGTLDPMATGVLVVAIGEATKLVPWLTAADKAYEATLRLGVTTDSLDADGREVGRAPVDPRVLVALRDATLGDEDVALAACAPIAAALAHERARAEQVPPAFSAIRVGGTRSHALARRGDVPELPPRPVAVHRLDVTGGGLEPEPHLTIALDVSKGYFVRSLARDLAAALGTVGHLTALRRTRSGPFSLEGSVALDAGPPDPGALARAIVPLAEAARRALPSSVLSGPAVLAAARGQKVHAADVRDPHASPSAWLDEEGRLVAIGEIDPEAGAGRVLRGFHDAG